MSIPFFPQQIKNLVN